MLILLGAIFALHIIGIILLLVATIDNVSASNCLYFLLHDAQVCFGFAVDRHSGRAFAAAHSSHFWAMARAPPYAVVTHPALAEDRRQYLTFFLKCRCDRQADVNC